MSDENSSRRVESITYRVISHHTTIYDGIPGISWDNDLFEMNLEGDTAEFLLKVDYSSAADARMAVEDKLKEWEIVTGLERFPEELAFVQPRVRFGKVEVNHEGVYKGMVETHLGISVDAILAVKRVSYPALPSGFARNDLVDQMYSFYCEYKQQGSRLAALGEYCLTLLEDAVGPAVTNRRKRTAEEFGIDLEVLNKLGELCSKGSPAQARKAPKGKQWMTHSAAEVDWLEKTVVAIILRVGEIAYDPSAYAKVVEMTSLPTL